MCMYRQISSRMHSFQDEAGAAKQCCPFFLLSRSHEEKQITIILGISELAQIIVVPVLKATIKQSAYTDSLQFAVSFV